MTKPIQIQLDVSYRYRNKTGYKVSGYRFNRSFQTVALTPRQLLDDVIRQGWPYTVAHAKREPAETGAAERGVVTPKHAENFVSSQLLTGDDDRAQPGVIAEWLNDPFFGRNGWAFVPSVNSKPHAEKGHPILIFDRPIADIELWRDCLKAFRWRYPQLDKGMENPVLVYCNPRHANVRLVSGIDNLCSFDVFEGEILGPYRAYKAALVPALNGETGEISAEMPLSNSRANRYVQAAIRAILQEVASAEEGQRHIILRDKSKRIGHLLSAPWHTVTLPHIQDELFYWACVNGYVADHNEAAARQTIASGIKLGSAVPAKLPDVLHDS